jgi:hypothetical protein
MGTSLTDTFEISETHPTLATAVVPTGGMGTIGPHKLVWQKETTEEWDHGSEILETAGTRARYVAAWVERQPQFSVWKIHSGQQGTAGRKEPGAGLIEERSIILQEWEGIVLHRDEESFCARLYEGFRDFPVKRAEISLEEVADEQHELVVPGARFSWMIGYRLRSGTRSRFSEIYFRRLPPWSKEELEKATRAVEKLREDAGWV